MLKINYIAIAFYLLFMIGLFIAWWGYYQVFKQGSLYSAKVIGHKMFWGRIPSMMPIVEFEVDGEVITAMVSSRKKFKLLEKGSITNVYYWEEDPESIIIEGSHPCATCVYIAFIINAIFLLLM